MNDALSNDIGGLFASLRRAADPSVAAEIEAFVASADDRMLCRVNPLAFAAERRLDEEQTIAAFLHAARLGVFELSWNVLCRSCGGVLEAGATLRNIDREDYACAFCAASWQPILDELVEVNFTVTRRVRPIAAHNPQLMPIWEYYRQIFWTSAIDLPEDFPRLAEEELTLDSVELSLGEKALLSLQLPAEMVIVFDPVTHAAHFVEVAGEPTRERQSLSLDYDRLRIPVAKSALRPGPLRLALENRSDVRVLPTVWRADRRLEDLLARRKEFLTAKRLLTNQTFRDLYGTDTIDPDQRLKITSLTFLFTDLEGSTELYERVGDLAAFDLVRAHFHALNKIVAAEAGAVVKTAGDAVMATFATPDRALAAALRMREAMAAINTAHDGNDLVLKIGIHEGPCLAVKLDGRQDYFGRTVNIASRVQDLVTSRAIYATGAVVEHPQVSSLLAERGVRPLARRRRLRGIAGELSVYEIP
jgi:class 3 adenylate cyclase